MSYEYPNYDQLVALVNAAMQKYRTYEQTVQANTQACDTQITALRTQITDKLKAVLTADVSGDSTSKASLETEVEELKEQISKLEEQEKQYSLIDLFDFIRPDLPAIRQAYEAVEPERLTAQTNLRQSMADLQVQIAALQKQYDEQQSEYSRIFNKIEEEPLRPIRALLETRPNEERI